MNVTEADIAALRLVDNPIIYNKPRTDNQRYDGRIVYVDEKRGYCIQLVGKRRLFVHRLLRLDVPQELGENVNINYRLGADKTSIQYDEVQHRVRSL